MDELAVVAAAAVRKSFAAVGFDMKQTADGLDTKNFEADLDAK
jgi:hypothetical protein